MKKSIVIILEIIIILCLLLALFGKVLSKQKENYLNLFSLKFGVTKVIAEKGIYNPKTEMLWMRAVVDLSAEPETRDNFLSDRVVLFKTENKTLPIKNVVEIKTNSNNFLWTDVTANPDDDFETKESFTYDRIALFNQENKTVPTKNISEVKTKSTNFLWTDVTSNSEGDSATRETFSAKRAILLK